MAGFVAGLDRGQTTLLPECLEDWVDENNSVRAVAVFVEALDLRDLGFEGAGVTQASGEVGAAATQMLNSASGLSKQSERLKTDVARFLDTVRAA